MIIHAPFRTCIRDSFCSLGVVPKYLEHHLEQSLSQHIPASLEHLQYNHIIKSTEKLMHLFTGLFKIEYTLQSLSAFLMGQIFFSSFYVFTNSLNGTTLLGK